MSVRIQVPSLASLTGLRIRGLDLTLLWLRSSQAAAALSQLLAWELPYAAGPAPKKKEPVSRGWILNLLDHQETPILLNSWNNPKEH